MRVDVSDLEYGAVQGALGQVRRCAEGFSCVGSKVFLLTKEGHDDEIDREGLAGSLLPAITF